MSDPVEYEPVTDWDWILETWHGFLDDVQKTGMSKDAAGQTAALLVLATILADWSAASEIR